MIGQSINGGGKMKEKTIDILNDNEFLVYLKIITPDGKSIYTAYKLKFKPNEIASKSRKAKKFLNTIKDILPKNHTSELVDKDEYWADMMGIEPNKYNILN
jgi:hypothetical protein